MSFDDVKINYDEMSPAAKKEFDDFHDLVLNSLFLTVDEKLDRIDLHCERMKRLIFN